MKRSFMLVTLIVMLLLVVSVSSQKIARQKKLGIDNSGSKIGRVVAVVGEAERMDLIFSDDPAALFYKQQARSKTEFQFIDQSGNIIPLPSTSEVNYMEYVDTPVMVNFTNGLAEAKSLQKLGTEFYQQLGFADYSSLAEPLESYPQAKGPYRTLVLMVSFAGQNGNFSEQTLDQARNKMFADENIKSVANQVKYYSSDKFGKPTSWLTGHNDSRGDIVAVTINVDVTKCDQEMRNSFTTAAINQLQLQGYSPNNYKSIFLVFQDSSYCNQPAWAQLRSINYDGVMYAWEEESGFLAESQTTAHELYHNMTGARHSGVCEYPDPDSTNRKLNGLPLLIKPFECTYWEYGDACTMGSGTGLNTVQLRRLGWNRDPYKKLKSGVNKVRLFNPAARFIASPLAKHFGSYQYVYANLSGDFPDTDIYLETRRNIPGLEFFSPGYPHLTQSVKVIFTQTDYLSMSAKTYSVDMFYDPGRVGNAGVLQDSILIGGVTVKNEFPGDRNGTRATVIIP